MRKRERLRQSEKLNINWKRLWRSVFILVLFCLKSADMKNECDRKRGSYSIVTCALYVFNKQRQELAHRLAKAGGL